MEFCAISINGMNRVDKNRWARIRKLFSKSVESATPEEAERILANEPDEGIRQEVAVLLGLRREPELAVDRRWGNILDDPAALRPGAILRERYRLERFLAAGGMGEVFAAMDAVTGERVAVKVLRSFGPPERAETFSRQRLEREARIVGRIDHPNVCRMRGMDWEHTPPYCVMDLLDGKTLAEWLADAGPLTIHAALPVLSDICAGLEAAHRLGIVHRDLKPGNVMMTDAGRAVIIDFGLATAVGQHHELAAEGGVIGTPAYLAPELMAGNGSVKRSADIYSLGVVMFEMLTGRKPAPGIDLNAPVPWRETILACLEHDPSRRPDSAGQVLLQLTG